MRKLTSLALLGLPVLLAGCGRYLDITYTVTPEQWCAGRPCVDMGGWILNEPLGSFLVFLLSAMSFWAALRFWQQRENDPASLFWALNLLLGGVASGVAGISYQAFSYELKCAGMETCVWTSWWEIWYMTIQNAGVNCMLVAVAYSCLKGMAQRIALAYALISATIHAAVTMFGAVTANQFLISFELLLLFSMPALFGLLIFNGIRYLLYRQKLDGIYFLAWFGIFAVNALYFAYMAAGYTAALYDDGNGIFFSENDVLHVGMIVWMLWAYYVIAPNVKQAAKAA